MSYTREQVLVMTAEELNRAIAELRGWVEDPEDFEYVRYDASGRPVEFSTIYDLPDWSGDIGAAWGLVEEILATDHEMTLSSETRNDNKRWSIVIFEFRNDGIGTGYTISHFVDADTAPLAISRAWLLWREGQG